MCPVSAEQNHHHNIPQKLEYAVKVFRFILFTKAYFANNSESPSEKENMDSLNLGNSTSKDGFQTKSPKIISWIGQFHYSDNSHPTKFKTLKLSKCCSSPSPMDPLAVCDSSVQNRPESTRVREELSKGCGEDWQGLSTHSAPQNWPDSMLSGHTGLPSLLHFSGRSKVMTSIHPDVR